MHLFYSSKITLSLYLSFPPCLDLSPGLLRPQYTSKSWPLTVPCSLPAHISWQQIKAKGLQEVHWHFVPESGRTPQRLFSLSLKDPLTWEKDQNRELRSAADLQKGNLSLTRSRGNEEDQGDYVCTMKFKNGVLLNRTVHVKVLQSKSKCIALYTGQLSDALTPNMTFIPCCYRTVLIYLVYFFLFNCHSEVRGSRWFVYSLFLLGFHLSAAEFIWKRPWCDIFNSVANTLV